MLLVVYAGSQVASTLLMATTMDKMQRRILLVMPLFFIFIVARFPTGLVLYWMTTNLWTVGQGLVTRQLVPRTPAPKLGGASASLPKRSSRTAPAAPAPAAAADGEPQPKPKPPAQPRRVRRKKGGARR